CYCEGEEQQMIDQALQMMSMIELFSVMAQEDGESGSGDFTSDDRQSDDCAVAHKPDESPPENANYCV
ncbi:MAG: hypothetical protein LUH53_04190, partial [Lachnospiraceae bacterium]|nr:hypothetical protein [Lachnospiraceae bacterium]